MIPKFLISWREQILLSRDKADKSSFPLLEHAWAPTQYVKIGHYFLFILLYFIDTIVYMDTYDGNSRPLAILWNTAE